MVMYFDLNSNFDELEKLIRNSNIIHIKNKKSKKIYHIPKEKNQRDIEFHSQRK